MRRAVRTRAGLGAVVGHAVARHRQAAEFDHDIRAARQFADRTAPRVEPLVQLAVIARDIDRGATVVEHDVRLGKGAGERDKVVKLRLEQLGIEAQAKRGEMGEALAEVVAEVAALGVMEHRAEHRRVGIPRGGMADPLEPAIARCDQCFENWACTVAEHQVGVADDGSAGAQFAVEPARRLRGDAVDEFDLTDRLERLVRPAR